MQSAAMGTGDPPVDYALGLRGNLPLRNRLSEVGVHVCTVKPGFVQTPMTAHLDLAGAISAAEAARQILKAAEMGANTRYVPWRWALVAAVVKSIPSVIFKRLSI